MQIPFVDLKVQYNLIKDEVDKAIHDVLNSCRFVMGENVVKFEEEFANLCKAKYAVSVGNGTDALKLALMASGIKAGDEVITVPNTFIATAESILNIGANVKFVDIDETYNIDVLKIKDAVTDKTKAILPVHLYGQPADMKAIKEIAEENNLIVIEDACQAHGAEYNGKKVPIAGIGCFSFYPGKNLGAYGDAGCVVTNNGEVAEKVMMLRDHGRKKREKYRHDIQGFNTRLDAMQAAVLRVKLRYLEKWNEARRKNAKMYNALLKDVVVTPVEVENRKHVYHLYVIRTKRRNGLQQYLKKQGVSTIIHYPIPLHLQPAYKFLSIKEGAFPVTEKYADEILSLPMYAELAEEQINFITDCVKDFLK